MDSNVAEGEREERAARLAGETDLLAREPEHLTLEDRTGLLRAMLMMRGIEQRAMMLYRQGKVPGSFYDGFGQEAVSAGPTWAMHGHDRLCILHRDLAAHLIRGVVAEPAQDARVGAALERRADRLDQRQLTHVTSPKASARNERLAWQAKANSWQAKPISRLIGSRSSPRGSRSP